VANQAKPYSFRPRVSSLERAPALARALSRLRGRRGLALLDSAAGVPRRFSWLGFDPIEPFLPEPGRPVLPELRRFLERLVPHGGDPIPGPFQGGFLGAIAYDVGVHGERPVNAAAEPWGFPLALGGLYCDFLVADHEGGRTALVLGEDPGDGRAGVAERRREILGLLAEEARGSKTAPRGELLRCIPARVHRARIESARERIARGDIYQANLAHRFTREVEGHPIDWYARLRNVNPAPYMGYLAWESGEGSETPPGAILSASPELLLEFEGGRARTRPIKGTIARGASAEEDQELARTLLQSEKDRAELVMIVDLERNDLGRIARPGRVWVEGLGRLQSLASVHHLIADVVAEPREGVNAVDCLCALFPGGSVTGAPKLASMGAIAELEGEGRGFFCGSLGFLDVRGAAAFNILIRTLLWRSTGPCLRGEVSFRVGGGITFASIADREDEETLAKAKALAAALEQA
jgi:para-aminobenzoate synthetase component 1